MRNSRRILVWLLALLLALSCIPAISEDADGYDDAVGIVYRRLLYEENSFIFDDMKTYIEEQSGAHLQLEFIADADFRQSINLKLAGGERVDAVELTCLGNDWSGLYADGLLQPVEDIFEEYAPNLYARLKDYASLWDANGHLYAVPSSQSFRRGTTNIIRQDWLDKLDMDMPATMDDFLEFCEAVKTTDMNGNGDPSDEYAVCGRAGAVNMFITFFTGGYNGNYADEDNNIWDVKCNEHYVELLDFVKTLAENGYMPKEWQTMDDAAWWDLFYADCAGVLGTWYSDYCKHMERLWEINPNASYVQLVPFKCVEGIQPAYLATKPYFNRMAFPASGSKEGIIEVAKFLEWVQADYDNVITCSYGIPDVDWRWSDRDNNIIEVLTDRFQAYSMDYYVLVQFWDMYPAWGFSTYADTYTEEMYRMRALCNAVDDIYYVAPVDYMVTYDYSGTAVEKLIGEGATLFNEAVAQYLADEISRDDFLAAQQTYIDMEGSVYSKVRTEQYKAALNLD